MSVDSVLIIWYLRPSTDTYEGLRGQPNAVDDVDDNDNLLSYFVVFSSFAPRHNSSKLDSALGLASVHLSTIKSHADNADLHRKTLVVLAWASGWLIYQPQIAQKHGVLNYEL